MDRSFDAVIVGAGQAAALAGRLTKAGWSVALVEKKWSGGTCVNVGCTPTKAMVASAKVADVTARAKEFGVLGGEVVRADLRVIKARKDAIVLNFRQKNESAFQGMKGCTIVHEVARFEAADRLRVATTFSPQKILPQRWRSTKNSGNARSGSRSHSHEYHDSRPRSIARAFDRDWGQLRGLEIAKMFRRFGSEVTVVERGATLLGHEDAGICRGVQRFCRRKRSGFASTQIVFAWNKRLRAS